MRLFITGGAGTCGSILKKLDNDKVFFDLKKKPNGFSGYNYIEGDLNNDELVSKHIRDCDVLIHLAAKDYYPDFNMGQGNASWEEYFNCNIKLTKKLFDLAISNNITKIIFASSHRVQGMYEKIYAPEIYEPNHNFSFDHNNEVCPDSIYAVSKLFGENLGKFHSFESKIDFKCVRICSVRDNKNDNPRAYADYGYAQGLWDKNSEQYNLQLKRLQALWQSRRDFLQLIKKIIESKKKGFDIFYGLSNNKTSWFNLKHTCDVLNYSPIDKSEKY